ncbi:hypothetical protein [Variovorax saccharolyticus]|uniref:hypothetical protein n=1 Tax=Variovorax saccharolyticus TaxID=3053516 RepID=UPI0025756CE2|nr:hypothetical protein [Variovorax sp. J31P216]MDM0030047.1 hypothetical protein [Variovorax sp. J31P216]
MAEIEHLSLSLPAGFEHRAARLARLTAQALAAQQMPVEGVLPTVRLAPLRLDAGRSDHALAGVLAQHIAAGIGGACGAGSL